MDLAESRTVNLTSFRFTGSARTDTLSAAQAISDPGTSPPSLVDSESSPSESPEVESANSDFSDRPDDFEDPEREHARSRIPLPTCPTRRSNLLYHHAFWQLGIQVLDCRRGMRLRNPNAEDAVSFECDSHLMNFGLTTLSCRLVLRSVVSGHRTLQRSPCPRRRKVSGI
jgi:hypothetical protein